MSITYTGHKTSTVVVNQSNQSWIIADGASVEVVNAHGIYNSAAFDHDIISVAGEVIADSQFRSGIMSEGTNAVLQIDVGGSIHAYTGISAYGENTSIENLGTITAANIGIYGAAVEMDIRNEGNITDAKMGIYLEDDSHLSGATISNVGLISGTSGIVTNRYAVTIKNEVGGHIEGDYMAVQFAINKGAGNAINSLTNDGVIESSQIAIQGGDGTDRIYNHGVIKGSIRLAGGNDTFDNTGGSVDHVVDGGLGDDTYIFGTKAFSIDDAGGIDMIATSVSASLADFPMIENLTLMGDSKINGTGNAAANIISGNSNANVLDGGVDSVVDTLYGGAGNDTYVLRDGFDKVVEPEVGIGGSGQAEEIQEAAGMPSSAGGMGGVEYANDPKDTGNKAGESKDYGIDTITSTINRSLADYNSIENLKLLGSGDINGTGNQSANVITGNDGNNVLAGGVEDTDVIDTLNGGKGNDTYVLFTGHDKVVDSAGIDTITSEISRSLADYPTIENLTLLGKSNINGTGNALVNVITGNDGNNILDGGVDTVVDTLKGGDGNDTYVLGAGADKVVETTGVDTITSTITRSLAGYANIENLTLKGTANIDGTGNALANAITGNSGNNILNGGTDNVVDTLNGGAGNDTYVLGSGSDKVTDSAGTDTITSSISRSLASYTTIENLTLTGSSNINATGNALANVLTGNSGMNTLDGGAGNDTYVLGSGTDKVVDSAGTDTITSSISRSLASYATIENLTLTGSGNINATGNALNNVLTGNSGMNTLDGGAGNDTYVLGSGTDKVVDSAGTDTITSTITRSLASFATIENLKLLGTTNIDATGNALANTLTGNSGNNTLSGGAGNDVLLGGAGADKLDGGANTDTASYAGASAGVVANLAKAASNTGDAKGDTYVSIENLTGSSHNDTLVGSDGANVIFGGAGVDKLTGGLGADTFVFKSAADTGIAMAQQDVIFDFSHSQGDRISLSGIDANSALSGDQGFLFKGTAAFSGANGELRFEKQASDTYVYGDINGDKVADFVIHIDSAVALQAGDFLL